MTDNQKLAVIDLLWDSLRRDSQNRDRRQTGWGTKTKIGLIACIDRIIEERSLPPTDAETEARNG